MTGPAPDTASDTAPDTGPTGPDSGPDSGPGTLSKDRLRLWLRLLKSSRAIEDEIRRRLRRDFASTLPRFDVMSALARDQQGIAQGLRMSEISARLKVSNGNVTGIVDRLAEEGLVRRVAEPGDRRAARVRLTPAGQAAFAAQARAHEGWIDALLRGLGSDDIAGMNARLDRLIAALDTRED